MQATKNLKALRAHCAKQTEVKKETMSKSIKGRLKLKMREKIAKKRNQQIVIRLNEFLADPPSDEDSDSYSEDEEKGQRIKELKRNIQSIREAKISKQDLQIKELEKEYEMVAAGNNEYVRVSEEVICETVQKEHEKFEENSSDEESSEENSDKDTEPTERKEKEKEKFRIGYFAKKIKKNIKKKRTENAEKKKRA